MITLVDGSNQRLKQISVETTIESVRRRMRLDPTIAALALNGDPLDLWAAAGWHPASAPDHAAGGGNSSAGAFHAGAFAPTTRSQVPGTRTAAGSNLN